MRLAAQVCWKDRTVIGSPLHVLHVVWPSFDVDGEVPHPRRCAVDDLLAPDLHARKTRTPPDIDDRRVRRLLPSAARLASTGESADRGASS